MDDLLEMSDSAFMENAGKLRSTSTTSSTDNTDAQAATAAVQSRERSTLCALQSPER